MPTFSTFGASAGRGFGLTASGATLNSVTFTANGNWVAPTSVSNVASISGKGSNGVSDYIDLVSSGGYGAIIGNDNLPNAPYGDWAVPYGSYTASLSQLNLSYPAYGPSSFIQQDFIFVGTNNKWTRVTQYVNLSSKYLTSYNVTTSGSPKTSGNVVYSEIAPISEWVIYVYGYLQGNAGTASTGLGKTFPGGTYTGTYPNGTGGTAPTTTFTNVTVTPGASYPIVVPSGGSVTIQYYT